MYVMELGFACPWTGVQLHSNTFNGSAHTFSVSRKSFTVTDVSWHTQKHVTSYACEQYKSSAHYIWWAGHVLSSLYLVSSTSVQYTVLGEEYKYSARCIWWAGHVLSSLYLMGSAKWSVHCIRWAVKVFKLIVPGEQYKRSARCILLGFAMADNTGWTAWIMK